MAMDYERLQKKKAAYQEAKKTCGDAFAAMEREFEIQYIYESNALEGNSLTLEETRAVLRAAEEGKDIAFCAELLESMRRKRKRSRNEK